jgi:branched-chain amino acid transport system permease protein
MAYVIHLLIMCFIFAILAFGLNLVVGQTGLLSVAHAAFYGIGAYLTAILMVMHHVPFWIAFVVAVLGSGLVAFIFGLILSTLRGDYYALGSLGLNMIVFGAMLNLDAITRGPLGIPGVPRPQVFGYVLSTPGYFLILVILFLALTALVCWYVTRAPFGRALKAIREDEDALQVFGYRVLTYKLTVFVLAAMLAGIAGTLYATYIRFVDPSAFTVMQSVDLLAMIILGGLATLRGSFVGACVFVLLYEGVRFLGFSPDIAAQMRLVVVGALLILLMMFRPQGIFGEYKLE